MLAPYRVLDLTDDRGAFAGFLLALLGAEVIAVEASDRPPTTIRDCYGRGKRSVDIGDDELFAQLVGDADVLIESGLPDGWDADRLAARNPALVHVTMSAFGSTGPKAGWPASDLVIWAASGAMANCGDADRAPVRPSVPQAWCHAGAAAVAGALAALTERARSGLGQHVDISAQRACTLATQSGLLAPRLGAPIPRRTPGGLTIDKVAYRSLYAAADGWVTITHVFGILVGAFTRRLMEWVHEEGHCDADMVGRDWVEYERLLNEGVEPLERWEEAKTAVQALTSSKTKAELLAGAIERRLVVAPISTIADVLANPQLASRDYWDDVDGVRHPGPFVRGVALPRRHLATVGCPGADTACVRDELAGRGRDPAQHGAATRPAVATGGGDRPLAGVKVVDLMWAVAGPTSARVLTDLGATVVRVESSVRVDGARNYSPYVAGVAGVENSGLFNNQNAGKFGITVDLGRPEGRAVVADLAAWADVVMESFSAGSMEAWGLGYDAVSAWNPSLIMLSSCLFGQTGPMSRFAGFGNLASALLGFHELTGWPDRAPVGPYGAYTDYVVPHLMASVVLAALDHRRRTGEGGHLDFAQAEAALHFLTPALVELQTTGVLPSRRGNSDAVASPHGVWAAAEPGSWVAVACETDTQRAALASVVGEMPVEAWLCDRAADDAVAALVAVGVPAHRVQGAVEGSADPQLEACGHWAEVDHPVHGPMAVETTRFTLSRTPVGPRAAAPLLNQHAHHVLVGLLGYTDDHFESLCEGGVLR